MPVDQEPATVASEPAGDIRVRRGEGQPERQAGGSGVPSAEVSGGAPARRPSERLSGAHRAAVLMAALGPERAANVMQRMGEDEIENLSLEMARLHSVGEETTALVLGDLAAEADAAPSVSGGMDFARAVVEQALAPERAAELLGRLAGATEARPFEFLRRVPPERIGALLRGESPQAIALVLASLGATQAAAVLAQLPEDEQPDIALRIARMGEADAKVIQQVEQLIRQKLGAVVERRYAASGGARALAGILNHADRSTERNVLERLAGVDRALAEEVRGMLFVFEDVVKLDERAIQQVLREVDQKDLVLALHDAPEALMEAVMANVSERAAATLKEEMEIQQSPRKRDVDDAQGRVVGVVRRLESEGTIVLPDPDGEDDQESERDEQDGEGAEGAA